MRYQFQFLLAMTLTALLVTAQDQTLASPQLAGTVVDASGAAIRGATMQVRSANGTVLTTTRSDSNGAFTISGLTAGDYRLVVSRVAFETKEIPVTVATSGALAPLRISLAVSGMSSTLNVQGRKMTSSASPVPLLRGRWAQKKFRIVPFFVREKFWRRSRRHHHATRRRR